MSLFNDVQGDTEPIMEFRSRFEGMVVDISRCKVIIPPLLLIMIFIRALHSHYSDILDQFHSRYKDLEAATLESVVADVTYHDGFQIVDPKKNSHQGGPKASAVATDKAGKTWTNPFEWLSSFSVKTIKTPWDRAIAGTGICPICHRAEKPWHVPANCPLLKDLKLKLVNGPPTTPAPASADSPAPAPAASPPAASPGVCVASANTPVSGGSGATPSGLTATVEEDEYSLDEDMFRWMGDNEGLDFGAPLGSSDKSNPSVSLYPSSFHVSVVCGANGFIPSFYSPPFFLFLPCPPGPSSIHPLSDGSFFHFSQFNHSCGRHRYWLDRPYVSGQVCLTGFHPSWSSLCRLGICSGTNLPRVCLYLISTVT